MTVTTDGQAGIIERVRALAHGDLTPLMTRLAEILRAGTDRDRAEGAGRLGPFDDIKKSTERRRARAGRGDGPPLRADDRSRFANVTVEPRMLGPDHFALLGGWPGTESFFDFHRDGTAYMVARDPRFVSDRTWGEMRQAIRDHFAALVAGGTP